jgi:hypothetical protein
MINAPRRHQELQAMALRNLPIRNGDKRHGAQHDRTGKIRYDANCFATHQRRD